MFKKYFAVMGFFMSAMAFAVEPVPMVDVQVSQELQGAHAGVMAVELDAVRKGYTEALNEEVNRVGKLDIIAVGPRAKLVITEYSDPSRIGLGSSSAFHPGAAPGMELTPQGMAVRESSRELARMERARIAGYVEYGNQRVSFEEEASSGTPLRWLAESAGRQALKVVRAL